MYKTVLALTVILNLYCIFNCMSNLINDKKNKIVAVFIFAIIYIIAIIEIIVTNNDNVSLFIIRTLKIT